MGATGAEEGELVSNRPRGTGARRWKEKGGRACADRGVHTWASHAEADPGLPCAASTDPTGLPNHGSPWRAVLVYTALGCVARGKLG